MPDSFDPLFVGRLGCRAALRDARHQRDEPFFIRYFLDNEVRWGGDVLRRYLLWNGAEGLTCHDPNHLYLGSRF
jgi:hypothetical protein